MHTKTVEEIKRITRVNKSVETNRLTLRLPNKLIQVLQNESEKRDLPLNAVINRILSKNVIFDMRMNARPTIIMSQALFSKILVQLDEQRQKWIVQYVPKSVKELFILHNLKYDLTNVIENHFSIMAKYCGWYTFNYDITGNKYRLVFESDLGQAWLSFLKLYIRSIIHSMRINITNEVSEESVLVFEIVCTINS